MSVELDPPELHFKRMFVRIGREPPGSEQGLQMDRPVQQGGVAGLTAAEPALGSRRFQGMGSCGHSMDVADVVWQVKTTAPKQYVALPPGARGMPSGKTDMWQVLRETKLWPH